MHELSCMAKDANMIGGTVKRHELLALMEEMYMLTVELFAVLVEDRDKLRAGVEGTITLVDGTRQVLKHNFIDSDLWGPPASSIDTTVHPIEASVGTRGRGSFPWRKGRSQRR
jgi:hypothetical protein